MVKGDVNQDGLVNERDVELLQRAVADMVKLKGNAFKAADMNNDKKITMLDVIELQKLLELKISGDANGDGMLTQDDVIVIQKAVAELLHLDKRLFENADINDDGRINMKDVIFLQKLLAGVIADNEAR